MCVLRIVYEFQGMVRFARTRVNVGDKVQRVKAI